MLQVNLNGPDHEVERVVAENCAEFGRVTSVKLHRLPSPFALIEMSRREQTFELATKYGGSAFGNCALVHLQQKTQ